MRQRIRETECGISVLPKCPQCGSEYAYENGNLYVCPECAHEWNKDAPATVEDARVVRDSSWNVLQDGDMVTEIKDLKVMGSSRVVKVVTKVKNIRRLEGDHDIDFKIEGIDAIQLKSEFVRKAQGIRPLVRIDTSGLRPRFVFV